MKIPQIQSDIDLEVVNSYTTDLSGIYKIITVDDKRCKYCTSLDRFQSCHDFILVEYNCFFGLIGLSLHVTECLFNSFSFQFYFILQFLRMFRADQAEKTIILHQDEIMAASKSIQGSTIFTTATKSKKMMSDFNFNPIPSEIKYFIPGKETVNDISNLFGSLFDVNVMSKIKQEICFVVVMLSLSMFICLMTCLQSLTHVDLSSTVIML
jgi:hypothetical protein